MSPRRLTADARVRTVRSARNWVTGAGYWQQWLALGVTIGLAAGLCAVAFFEVLALTTHVLTGILGGYKAPAPASDGDGQGTGHFPHTWAIPVIVSSGAVDSLRTHAPALLAQNGLFVLPKPFDLDGLLGTVQKALAESPRAAYQSQAI